MNTFLLCLCLLAIVPSTAFLPNGRSVFHSRALSRSDLSMATATAVVAEKKSTKSPDFYWEFRLERLINKKGKDFVFDRKNYEVTDAKNLYYAYYLDLTLNGSIDNSFDKFAENQINDEEWLSIYGKIAAWTKEQADKSSSLDVSVLPKSDFDLVAKIYPQVDMKDLNMQLDAIDFGSDFPYHTMKEMIDAAIDEKLSVGKKVSFNDVTEAMDELHKLKDKSMKSLESIMADTTAFANNQFPDEESKNHYRNIRERLAKLPQTPQQWETYRSNMVKQIDEMARLASKKVEPHHHGHDDEHHDELSPAEEFEKKYGRNLAAMAETSARYMSNPAGYIESLITQKFGQRGLDVWKKSEELAAKASMMKESEKAKLQSEYSDFLKQA